MSSKTKKILSPQEKKARCIKSAKTAAVVITCLVLVFGIFMGIFAIVNVVGFDTMLETAKSFSKVQYGAGEQLVPTKDTDGYWTFTTDEDLKILQFTDIHIGAGFASFKRDTMALNAVASMITVEKPDLVVLTGDLAYPVPFQAGTFNNITGAELISTLMETLGVYWTFNFGNHDTESYSMYDREDICEFYEGRLATGEYKYCLFQRGPSEIYGYGNTFIKVKNNEGKLTQAIATIDSNAYLPGDNLGIGWEYDSIHQDQIDWYVSEMTKFRADNAELKSLAFFHIPLQEMRTAYSVVRSEGLNKDKTASANGEVIYNYGSIGEKDPYVFSGVNPDTFFEQASAVGLQGTFTGHDHYNNLSVTYKGVRMTYGMSIDYLAYMGIYKEGNQRGCTVITLGTDGNFDVYAENYYQQKYKEACKYPQEKVKLNPAELRANLIRGF